MDEVNIIQVNTGSGTSRCSDDKLKFTIQEAKAHIAIISESNIDLNDPSMIESRARYFPDFVFIDKVLPGSTIARLSLFISKEIEHERMPQYENDINSTAVMRVRKNSKKIDLCNRQLSSVERNFFRLPFQCQKPA